MEQVKVEIAPVLYEKWLQLAAVLEKRSAENKKAQTLIITQEQHVIFEENDMACSFLGDDNMDSFEEAFLFIENRLDLLSGPHFYNGKLYSGYSIPEVSLPPDCDRLPEMIEDFMGWSSFLAPVELVFTPNWFCSIKYNHTIVFEASCCAEAIAYMCDQMKCI